MKFKLLMLIATITTLVSCNKKADTSLSSSSSISSSQTSSTSSDTSTSSQTSSSKEEKVLEITCLGWNISKGTNFSDSKGPDKLKNALNGETNLISSIEVNSCYSGAFGEMGQNVALQVGSSSSEGSLKFNFSQPIISIAFDCSSYWKTYNGGATYDLNAACKIYLEDQTFANADLSASEASPTLKTITYNNNEGFDCICFGSISNEGDANRVMINKINIKYFAS